MVSFFLLLKRKDTLYYYMVQKGVYIRTRPTERTTLDWEILQWFRYVISPMPQAPNLSKYLVILTSSHINNIQSKKIPISPNLMTLKPIYV